MDDFRGVTIGVKAKDTIKISDDNGVVASTTIRDNTWLIQTPQCFDKELLLRLHDEYLNDEATDDCLLLEKGGYDIKIIPGDYSNMKITTREDFDIIKCLIKK